MRPVVKLFCARHPRGREALVVAEVEVGLGAVVGDEDLAVLVRAHRARVDVDVRVELHVRDAQAARLEQRSDRGAREPLADRGDDPAGDEHVLRGLAAHGGFLRSGDTAPAEPGNGRPRPCAAEHVSACSATPSRGRVTWLPESRGHFNSAKLSHRPSALGTKARARSLVTAT